MPHFLGATGIGVGDLDRSLKFYTDVLQLGLEPTQTFDVAAFKEIVLAFPKGSKPAGSQIILMEYKNTPAPKNQLGKLVFYVDDVKAVYDRCKGYGCKTFKALGEGEGWVKEIAMIRDPDGFVLEFLPATLLSSSGKLGEKVGSSL
jgi:lactoylglutathione lyase